MNRFSAPALHSTKQVAAPLEDAEARRQIAEDLDTNLLVEAGAGSGKTTALVGRMAALVRTGRARVEQIAAVTFTRKAAAELRERFQLKLESDAREARKAGHHEIADRLDAALRDLDRATLGTIHSFCARLLREHPLEAGVDPDFEEISGVEETRIQRAFWERHLQRLSAAGDPLLAQLAEVGIRPHQLWEVFLEVSGNPDVDWPAPETPRPDPRSVRSSLERWLDGAMELLPDEEPEAGWDGLQDRVRSLHFSRYALGWNNDVHFFDALAIVCGSSPKLTQKRWGESKESKQAAKALLASLEDFSQQDGAAQKAIRSWYAHRYPLILRFALRASDAYGRERRREGTLTFSDLLQGAAQLLRDHPDARQALGERFRRLLVDEFQDTDPVQAEVMFLLATEPGAVDWQEAIPRPGALFVVGDPKQSIYRFRRADIAVYNAVKRRFRSWQGVLTLTANFRSRESICNFANEIFQGAFPPEETEHQAAFARLEPHCSRDPAPRDGVLFHSLALADSKDADAVAEADAEQLARWIAGRVQRGERTPGDFLVLTQRKSPLAGYARELERYGIPVRVSGSGVGVEDELSELLLLLRALAHPADESLILAVLTGLFFGINYETLTRHALSHGSESRWTLRDDTKEPNGPVETALAAMGRWRRVVLTEPADVAVEALVEELGLLPYAAAGELGDTRAGALLFALDRVRAAALAGETSFAAVLDTVEALLSSEEAETPLDPGRTDVVRIMNLHKAKGLEAPVVVLAYPTGQSDHEPYRHIARPINGRAEGYLHIQERNGWKAVTLARPADWDEHAAAETQYARAEATRLLYVAGTRAMDELVICRCSDTDSKSPWQAFHSALEGSDAVQIPELRTMPRQPLGQSLAEIMHGVEQAAAVRVKLVRT
jgi:ATP-dependent helicase/nuclease subunit A